MSIPGGRFCAQLHAEEVGHIDYQRSMESKREQYLHGDTSLNVSAHHALQLSMPRERATSKKQSQSEDIFGEYVPASVARKWPL
jgi:hypothetical protein